MNWRDEYSVGIEEIDARHRQLIAMFLHVEQSIDSGSRRSDINAMIMELREFAYAHFSLEQGMMRLFGDHGIARHIANYWHFFDEIADMERRSLGLSSGRKAVGALVD